MKENPVFVETDLNRDCVDTDNGATDSYGDGCDGYTNYPSWCNGYDDDDFVSSEMCCACGGGDEGSSDGGDEGCPDGTTEYTWSYDGSWASEVSWELVDANGDTALNVLDVVLTVNLILNGVCTYEACSDINSDNSIDVIDVILIVDIILQ